MSRFGIRHGRFGSHPSVILEDGASQARATLCSVGATLLRWVASGGTAGAAAIDLVDGYASPAELASQAGVRNGIMAPFANRIAAGRYRFDGETHDLMPGADERQRLIYHGFVRQLELPVVAEHADDQGAGVSFACRAIRPGVFAGYPFAIDLRISYRLAADGLALSIEATNVGDRPAPFSCGWHPYFRLGSPSIDSLELTVAAGRAIATDDRLIPLAGQPPGLPPALDFRQPRQLGPQVIDACLAEPAVDADGIARSRLRNPANGWALDVWQVGGLTHLFTGDTLARDRRAAIAIEPVSAMTDAYNRPELADAIRLAPGATRYFHCGASLQRPAA